MRYCFIFPHAGSLKSDYNTLISKLNSEFECIFVERHLRGVLSWRDLIEKSLSVVLEKTKNLSDDYILLGHSLGALQAYYLLKEIETRKLKDPSYIFLSAMTPPTQKNLKTLKEFALLEREQFKSQVISMSGLPQEIIDNPDACDYFLTRVRNDMTHVEKIDECHYKAQMPLHLIVGDEDQKYSFLNMSEWNQFSEKEVDMKLFKGNHFFLTKKPDVVSDYILKVCMRYF